MTGASQSYRAIAIGQQAPKAVTVGIEAGPEGNPVAAIWWEAQGDTDAEEAGYDSVEEALAAAEAARQLHGLEEVVVVLARPDLWNPAWGQLRPDDIAKEPIGSVEATGLSTDEAFNLAATIEEERDA